MDDEVQADLEDVIGNIDGWIESEENKDYENSGVVAAALRDCKHEIEDVIDKHD